jgi:hypothetical protein
MREIEARFMNSSGEFDAVKTRRLLLSKAIKASGNHIVRYPFKPFDMRFAYLSAEIAPLFSRPSPELLAIRELPKNAYFVTRDYADRPDEGPPVFYSSLICDYHFLSGEARHFPTFVKAITPEDKIKSQPELFNRETIHTTSRANLSPRARAYLAGLGLPDPDADPEAAALIWLHALAVGFSPQYLVDNADGVQSHWPRIPLPGSAERLRHSADLGKQIAALLNTDDGLSAVTKGDIRPELRLLAVRQGGDLAITARWGYLDGRQAVMPGGGDARQRDYTPEERAALETGAATAGLTLDDALDLLGETTYDLHLNETTCWANVPANVYDYTIGGYQVIKKWLSYRNQDVIDRPITEREAREVVDMTRRIAALLWLTPALNANYRESAAQALPLPE